MAGVIQIAGALDEIDVQNIIASGADELALPVGPFLHTPELSDAKALRLFRFVQGKIGRLAITYLTEAASIRALLIQNEIDRLQLHGDISLDEIKRLREMIDCTVVKSLAIGRESAEELFLKIKHYEEVVDSFIFDTFDPTDGATGATGKVHDWNISRELRSSTSKPVILAGGLSADNVGEAIRTVRPQGVDAHTRLESKDGRKDCGLINAFVKKARQAFDLEG